MGAEGDHDVELDDVGSEVLIDGIEEEWEGSCAGVVGDDEEDGFAFVFSDIDVVVNPVADLIVGEEFGHGWLRFESLNGIMMAGMVLANDV